MDFQLFDGWGGEGFLGDFGLLGEGDGGDLEAVEQEAGAAGVELVEGDAGEDLGDGALDAGAVFDEREVEGAAASFSLAGVADGAAGGVVEVAERLVAEGDGAAAPSVGVDVAALGKRWVRVAFPG